MSNKGLKLCCGKERKREREEEKEKKNKTLYSLPHYLTYFIISASKSCYLVSNFSVDLLKVEFLFHSLLSPLELGDG
jgi:hypothetical protein